MKSVCDYAILKTMNKHAVHPHKIVYLWVIVAVSVVALCTIIAVLIGQTDRTMRDQAATPETTETALSPEEETYVGLTESEALDKADRADTPARVVMRDGQAQITTKDLRPGRLNFTVKDDIVTAVKVE